MSNRILSSSQWFSLLDRILLGALEFILLDTHLVQHWISQLVNYQHTYKKRAIGIPGSWDENIDSMLRFLEKPSVETLSLIRLDRSYQFAMLREWDALMRNYELAFEQEFKGIPSLAPYHLRAGASDSLLQTHAGVTTLHRAALDIKRELFNQYRNYIRAIARYDAANHPLNSNEHDLKQGYYLAADRAIDHFNVDRGSFKSYLDVWIKKSRNSDFHLTGSAFSVPAGAVANHLSVPLDSVDPGVIDESTVNNDDIMRIHQLIRLVDPEGYAAELLEITLGA